MEQYLRQDLQEVVDSYIGSPLSMDLNEKIANHVKEVLKSTYPNYHLTSACFSFDHGVTICVRHKADLDLVEIKMSQFKI